MRFRHKLSIVLVGLAIVPLAATGVLIAALLEHDQVTRVDNRVAVSAAASGAARTTPRTSRPGSTTTPA